MPIRIRVAFLLLVAATSVARAQDLSVDQIVARHLEARGGAARLKAIQNVVYSHGKYHEPGYDGSGNAFMAMARPYYKIVGDPQDTSADLHEGYDGSAWEWYRSPGILVRTVGAANAARGGRHRASEGRAPPGAFSRSIEQESVQRAGGHRSLTPVLTTSAE